MERRLLPRPSCSGGTTDRRSRDQDRQIASIPCMWGRAGHSVLSDKGSRQREDNAFVAPVACLRSHTPGGDIPTSAHGSAHSRSSHGRLLSFSRVPVGEHRPSYPRAPLLPIPEPPEQSIPREADRATELEHRG